MAEQFCHVAECDGRGEQPVERRDHEGDYLDTVMVCSEGCREEVLATLELDNLESERIEEEENDERESR